MKLIRPADWTEMPWRNGGGVTSVIAAERQGDAILWRMSTAIVDCDGPYSAFPGLKRISTVIQGNGTVLHDLDSDAVEDLPPLAPTLLNGDVAWQGELKDGPIRHFNLIFDINRVRASVEVLRLDGRLSPSPGTHALFCVSGVWIFERMLVEPFDTILVPKGDLEGSAVLLGIRFAGV